MMVKGAYDKRPAIFKGNLNKDFHNINYEVQNHEEYDELDDDDRRQIVVNGDIV